MKKRFTAITLGTLALAGLAACGGGSSPAAPTPTPTPAPRSAAVTASGSGYVVVHPSRYSTWAYALETPVRIRETGGGTAKWNYARLSLVRGGREVERAEIGADILAAAPDVSNVTANLDSTYRLTFRLNSGTFDRVDITLGFTDVSSARQFTVDVPFSSFTGVDVSVVAMSDPAPRVERLP